MVAQTVKHLPAMWGTRVWSLGWEDPLEKEMATHSSILAWRIPWTEKPGRLWSMGSQSWTRLSDFTFAFLVSFGMRLMMEMRMYIIKKFVGNWEPCSLFSSGNMRKKLRESMAIMLDHGKKISESHIQEDICHGSTCCCHEIDKWDLVLFSLLVSSFAFI